MLLYRFHVLVYSSVLIILSTRIPAETQTVSPTHQDTSSTTPSPALDCVWASHQNVDTREHEACEEGKGKDDDDYQQVPAVPSAVGLDFKREEKLHRMIKAWTKRKQKTGAQQLIGYNFSAGKPIYKRIDWRLISQELDLLPDQKEKKQPDQKKEKKPNQKEKKPNQKEKKPNQKEKKPNQKEKKPDQKEGSNAWTAAGQDQGTSDEVSCSRGTKVEHTTSFPYSATVKLIFQSASGQLGSCTGSFFLDDSFILTAARCVHDGQGFAQWIFVIPAVKELPHPLCSTNDFTLCANTISPYSNARAVYAWTYPGFLSHALLSSDQALVMLDRPLGNRTGVFQATSAIHDPLNSNAYPSGQSGQGCSMVHLESRVDFSYLRTSTHLFVRSQHATTPGEVGAPAYSLSPTSSRSSVIFGTLLEHTTCCWSYYVRLTESKRQFWKDIVREQLPAPQRPQIVEYALLPPEATKSISRSSVHPGQSLTIEFSLWNLGWASTTANIFLRYSSNPTLSEGDPLLYPDVISRAFEANAVEHFQQDVRFPDKTAHGLYYIGVSWTSSVSQYDDANDAFVIGTVFLDDGHCAVPSKCSFCAADAMCGWCASTKTCHSGRSTGPFDFTCTQWKWSTSECL